MAKKIIKPLTVDELYDDANVSYLSMVCTAIFGNINAKQEHIKITRSNLTLSDDVLKLGAILQKIFRILNNIIEIHEDSATVNNLQLLKEKIYEHLIMLDSTAKTLKVLLNDNPKDFQQSLIEAIPEIISSIERFQDKLYLVYPPEKQEHEGKFFLLEVIDKIFGDKSMDNNTSKSDGNPPLQKKRG